MGLSSMGSWIVKEHKGDDVNTNRWVILFALLLILLAAFAVSSEAGQAFLWIYTWFGVCTFISFIVRLIRKK
jgi:hypothetical protein